MNTPSHIPSIPQFKHLDNQRSVLIILSAWPADRDTEPGKVKIDDIVHYDGCKVQVRYFPSEEAERKFTGLAGVLGGLVVGKLELSQHNGRRRFVAPKWVKVIAATSFRPRRRARGLTLPPRGGYAV